MALSKWQPSTYYVAGTVVIPTTVSAAQPTAIPNSDFESGDTGWTKEAGWAINTTLPFSGTYSAEFTGPGAGSIVSDTKIPVAPGKAITATCFVHQGASDDGQANAAVTLVWYDSGDLFLSTSTGNSVSTGAVGAWQKSTVSGTAPPGAASVSIGCSAYNDWTALNVDGFAWNYVSGVAGTGLSFKAVVGGGVTSSGTFQDASCSFTTSTRRIAFSQTDVRAAGMTVGCTFSFTGSDNNDGTYTVDYIDANGNRIDLVEGFPDSQKDVALTFTIIGGGSEPVETPAGGMSGNTEPVWPSVVGVSVQDNEITWEGLGADAVTWEASSILTSGQTEPTWPTTNGSFISDNNIAWETIPLRIEDENCPHTKVVAIAASKVFAGDTDIVRFCATLNARDWSSEDDAGFLPSGLQQKSQVGVDAMGVYRGNLAVWSASTFQVWQVDPDPAAMALLDAMEGIGSIHQQAVQPVSDDLFFLAALGVRTVSIAEGANNLAAGDVGVPIDILVQTEVNQPDVEPIATYYPGAGQYWLAFRPLTIVAGLLAGQFLLTSTQYPIEATDAISTLSKPERYSEFNLLEDGVSSASRPLGGELDQVLLVHTLPPEAIQTASQPHSAFLGSDIVEYNDVDAIDSTSVPLDSSLEKKLIVYVHPDEEESIQSASVPLDGDLT